MASTTLSSNNNSIGQHTVDTHNMSSASQPSTLQEDRSYIGNNDIEKAIDPTEPQGTLEGKLDDNGVEANPQEGSELERPASKDFPDLAPSRSMEFPDGMFFYDVL